MSIKRFFILFICSLLAGMCQAFTFALTIEGKINTGTLWLPSVITSTLIGGTTAGLILSPILIWVFRNRRLFVGISCLYIFSVFVTAALNLLKVRFSAFVSLAIIIAAVIVYHVARPVVKDTRPDK